MHEEGKKPERKRLTKDGREEEEKTRGWREFFAASQAPLPAAKAPQLATVCLKVRLVGSLNPPSIPNVFSGHRCRIPEPNVAMCTSRGQLFAIGREGYCSDPTRMASRFCHCCSRHRVQSRTVQSSEAKASFLPLGREDHRPDPMWVAFECSPNAPVAATESRILPWPEARPAVWHKARRLQRWLYPNGLRLLPRTAQSLETETSCSPSGERATSLTKGEWPLSVLCDAPRAASQSRTVQSLEAEASCLQSDENAIVLAGFRWPRVFLVMPSKPCPKAGPCTQQKPRPAACRARKLIPWPITTNGLRAFLFIRPWAGPCHPEQAACHQARVQ